MLTHLLLLLNLGRPVVLVVLLSDSRNKATKELLEHVFVFLAQSLGSVLEWELLDDLVREEGRSRVECLPFGS